VYEGLDRLPIGAGQHSRNVKFSGVGTTVVLWWSGTRLVAPVLLLCVLLLCC
jgi:hypothetical protein